MKTSLPLLCLSFVTLASCPGATAETPQLRLTLETNIAALPQNIVDLFVPPTRPQDLFVATAQQVFRCDDSQTNWEAIYAAPAATTILGISGYAKASSVLYVVHSGGVARTRDGGGSWLESVPPDYTNPPASFAGISVHPTNRREAALVFRTQAWHTRDFGESFNRLTPPLSGETMLDVAYAGSDAGILVFLTERALHLTTNAGESWTTLPREKTGRAALATSAKYPAAVVATDQGGLLAYDLSRPGFRRVQQVERLGSCEAVSTDCAGRGLLWGAGGPELGVFAVLGQRAGLLASHVLDEPVRLVRAHPRLPDQALVAVSRKVLLARVENAPATEAATNLWDFASFRAGPLEESRTPAPPPAGTTQAEMHELLSGLAAPEPPLGELVSASLDHARYSDEDISRWKKRARARNWLPELRVGAGFREYPQDQSEIYSYVDRYGIPHRDDLRLSDTIEPMGFVSATLVWDLPRLLFDREEVNINREKRYEMSLRNALITQVTTLYYERLDLLLRIRLRADKMPVEERISTTVKLRQKTELLNQLCGRPLLPLPSTSAPPRSAAPGSP